MAIVIQIQAPHFTAGAIIMEGRVLSAAPIIKYMQGWRWNELSWYTNKKGWTVKIVHNEYGGDNDKSTGDDIYDCSDADNVRLADRRG